jgi:alkanesulfonate monooxygenase SsuD/methylene tetrahydromethanopterin reductase-like flavin-dependent oxidoreductase (luciferase family)
VPAVKVGIHVPSGERADLEDLRRLLARVAEAGIDYLGFGDHVSFHEGWRNDGLIAATAYAMLETRLTMYVGVYLLPLRHPVLVARQLATFARLAPGRLVLGVGVGGEDRHEVEVCGVDPSSRGRRMDESLQALRLLMQGEAVTFQGEFFDFEAARILPTPSEPIPLVVGGRSNAAVRRAGRFGDGWVGIWNSARRFAEAAEMIEEEVARTGRQRVRWQHAMQIWCGFGASREVARALLAAAMEETYDLPFAAFERYCPAGRPEDVAAFLAPYVEAGCTTFNFIPIAGEADEAVEQVAAVRRLLVG